MLSDMYKLIPSSDRLLFVDIATPVGTDEVARLSAELSATLKTMAEQIIFVVDWSRAELLPPHVTKAYLTMMRADNPRILRSAFMVSENGLAGQQLERLISEAGNPKRRLFRNRPELETWMQEVTTPGEQQSLRAHLNGNGHK